MGRRVEWIERRGILSVRWIEDTLTLFGRFQGKEVLFD